MLTSFSLSCLSPNYLHIAGSGDYISSRDISFLHTLAQNEVFLRSKKIITICREHGITMPVIDLNYTNFPFKITLRSLTSMGSMFSEYCGVFEASEVQTEGTHVVIILHYPTGQSSRTIRCLVFTKPGGDSDTTDPDLDHMLDRCYTFRVQA
jgi:hypothetical protein